VTLSHVATGTVATATSGASNPITCSPAYPGGGAAGDLAVLTIVSRHDTEATPTVTPGGGESWASAGSASGGGGTFGAGTGPARITWFTHEMASGSPTAPTVNLAGTNTGRTLQAVLTILHRTAGDTFEVVAVFVAEATAGTGWTQAHTSDPGITSGDLLVLGYGVRDDQHSGFTAMGVTATSATISAVTERADAVTGNGNDQGIAVGTADVTAGTATANATQTATIGTSESGEMGLLRVREYTPPAGPQLDGATVEAEASSNVATTGARDVATDRSVWIFVTHNNSTAATVTSTVTDNSASITPALVLRRNTQAGTTAEVWRGYNSSGSTVSGYTVTATGSSGGGTVTMTHIVLAVFSGEEETFAGDSDVASNASGLPSITLTTTRDDSWCWSVKSDWSAGGTGTLGSSQSLVHTLHNAVEYTSDVWNRDDRVASSSSVTLNETAPAAQNFNQVAVEIRLVEAAAAPGPIFRRRRQPHQWGLLVR